MKKIISALFILTVVLTYGQDRDKRATEILDRVVEKTNSYKNFEADFAYKMINEAAGIDQVKEATIAVEGDKYRLNIAGQVVICDGKTVWTILSDDEEVMVNEVEESDESITPSNLLNKYNEKYKSKFMGEFRENGKVLEMIELKPLEGKTYSKVEVVIDKEKEQITSFTIFDKNGTIYAYEIKDFKPDVEVSSSTFTFDPIEYPDFDVIDMR